MLDEKLFVRSLLNRAGDSLAVLWAENQRAQNEQVESTLQKFEASLFAAVLGSHLTRRYARLGKMSTGKNWGRSAQCLELSPR